MAAQPPGQPIAPAPTPEATWDADEGSSGPFTRGLAQDATRAGSPGAGAWAPPVEPGRGVSAGILGTPGAAVLDERGNLPGAVVGLLAAALVAVGVFLPWIGVEGSDVSGWSASADAKVLLGVAAAATVIAALLIGGARSLVLRLGLVGLGVVAVGFGLFEVASANGIDEFDVSPGTGLFVVLAGGVALAVAGALTRHRRFLPARA